MAGNSLDDQDAIAAQWEASLDSEDPTEAAEAAAANELSGTMALQWAAMVEDGSRDFGGGKNGGEGVLRASADARNRVRPPGAADDHVVAQLHLRQRRGLAGSHYLGAVRRLHEFDSAAGGAVRVQGRGMGEFRAGDGRFKPDLFDDRRAAGRPPRPDLAAHRGPPLHHHRDQPRQAAG